MIQSCLNSDQILKLFDSEQALISIKNYMDRARNNTSIGQVGIKKGDICWIDYGVAYKYEAGYQHLGLVLTIHHGKALVVPMTSNSQTYQKSEKEAYLYPLKRFGKMQKDSALFLNDAKFISMQRVIKVIEHLNPESENFKEVKQRYITLIGD